MTRSRLFYVRDSLEENDVGDQVVTLLERLPQSHFDARVVRLRTLRTQGPWSGAVPQLSAPREAKVVRSVAGFARGPRRAVESDLHLMTGVPCVSW